jgi:hypothetical protein
LKDIRVDLSASNNYTIRYASAHEHRGVELLLKDPSAEDYYALRCARIVLQRKEHQVCGQLAAADDPKSSIESPIQI